ncbi:hypothetical protein TIFTF001_046010, partial [Ficus carica]
MALEAVGGSLPNSPLGNAEDVAAYPLLHSYPAKLHHLVSEFASRLFTYSIDIRRELSLSGVVLTLFAMSDNELIQIRTPQQVISCYNKGH